jgi:hypothetical protein
MIFSEVTLICWYATVLRRLLKAAGFEGIDRGAAATNDLFELREHASGVAERDQQRRATRGCHGDPGYRPTTVNHLNENGLPIGFSTSE